ncbi:hypothetical protein C5B91_20150 [Haloferax sp. Atlit-10N]|uniref:hypothetical protein n=1 Tax=unclassified Haloferax TaxID=2625095 RepID=UPI000E276DFB|nr:MULTISPECIES: hypothetical protein [unclassified Haloferax]RDZ39407.1 hypothetical protein C5B87_19410 [Haloferax sp. Atlit-16N]RDZ53922.1 hypothetical protein C5B91_20150 [Haloferax sp. Atlit-10N]
MALPDAGNSPEDDEAARQTEQDVRDARDRARRDADDDRTDSTDSSNDTGSSIDQSREQDRNVVEQRKSQQRGDRYDSGDSSDSGTGSSSRSSGGSQSQPQSDPSRSPEQDRNDSEQSGRDSRNADRSIVEQRKSQRRGNRYQTEDEQRDGPDRQTYSDIAPATGSVSGQPGGLDVQQGVETQSDRIGNRARDLEQTVVDEYDLSEDDVRIRRDGDRLVAELTDTGEQILTERQAAEQRSRQRRESVLEEQLTGRSRREQARRQIAETAGVDLEQIDNVRKEDGRWVASIDRTGERRNSLEGIGTSERELARQRIAEDIGVDPEQIDNVRKEDGRWVASVDRSPDSAQNQPATPDRPDEQFGDIPIYVGDGKRVEDYLRAASADYDEFVDDAVDLTSKYNPYVVASRTAYDAVDEYTPQWVDNIAVNPTTGRTRGEEFARGTVEGAAQLGNVPATALGLKEGAEFVYYVGSEAAEGNAGDVASDVEDAATAVQADVAESVTQNPASVGGMVAGSLVASVGGLAAASGRAGRVARYAVQPGEEIATDVATAALSRSTRGQRVLSRLPGGRIDNEEIAYAAYDRGVRPATSELTRRIRRTRYDVERFAREEASQIGEFVRGSGRAQADLAGPRSRPSVEVDESPGRMSPELDAADAAEQDLDQAQFELGRFAEQERQVQREQLEDFESESNRDLESIRRSRAADSERYTVDPDVLEEETRRQRRALERDLRRPRRRRVRREPQDELGEPWDLSDVERRNQRAVERSVRAEAESLERQATGSEVATGDLAQREAQRRELATRPSVEARTFETERVGEREATREMTSELERSAELERELEREAERVETEFETETVSEMERERERELAIETEIESEYERERERFDKPSFDEVSDDEVFGFDVDEDIWRSSIADVDDLLRGLRGDR